MSKINLAHVRIQNVDCAIFDADASMRTPDSRSRLLSQLTMKAERAGLNVDKSALAFAEHGGLKFFGTRDLVDFLAHRGLPQWTHSIDA